MYQFRHYKVDWLNVYVAQPSVGAKWVKLFQPGVTPLNQFSLNIYTAGRFEISAPSVGFKQVLGVGESNLDLTLDVFPTTGMVTETPLEAPACRMCLSVDGGGKWSRRRFEASAGQRIALSESQIAFVLPHAGWTGDGEPDFRVGQSFDCPADAFIYIMERQQ